MSQSVEAVEAKKAATTPKETAELLLNNLRKGKETHDIFTNNFRNMYMLSGRTVKEWEQHFKISVPQNPDPATCRMLDMEIMELHQEASFLFAVASAAAQALQKGSDTEYRARYAAIVEEFRQDGKKIPAAATIESVVRHETDDIESALANAEIQKEFWKNMMDHLNMCRRLLENATINSGIEAKLGPQEIRSRDGQEREGSNRGSRVPASEASENW